jgi:hypothetical protein
MAEHKVPLSWGIMRVGRSLSTLDASLQTLVPEANFLMLCRAYFRDRERRRHTVQGRRDAMRTTLAHASAVAGDLQVLLGTGVRDQALRLHGMLDRLTHVRMVLLTYVERAVLVAIVVLFDAAMFDVFYRHLPESRHWHVVPGPFIHYVANVLPSMDPFYWLLVLGFALYLFRTLRAVRNTIARSE